MYRQKPEQKKLKVYQAALDVLEYHHSFTEQWENKTDVNDSWINFRVVIDNICLMNYLIGGIKLSDIVERIQRQRLSFLRQGQDESTYREEADRIAREYHDAIVTFIKGVKEIEQERPNNEVLITGEVRIIMFALWLMDKEIEDAWREIILGMAGE